MKKILIFSLAYYPYVGGAEVAIKEITDRTLDIEFHMVTMRFSPADKREEKIGNVFVHRIGNGNGKLSKLFFQFNAARVAGILNKKYKFDGVWAMMAHSSGVPVALFNIFHPEIRYALTLQEGDPIPHIEKTMLPLWPLFTRSFKRASVIQVISNYLGGWARQRGYKGRIEVIPNGVDVKKFQNEDQNVKRIIREKTLKYKQDDICLITTSRLTEKNAVGDIIEALKFLPEKYKLLILGIGHLEKKLREKAINLNLGERVDFFGLQSPEGVVTNLHASDIFVRPSLSEGMGNSFIEAMAAGIPVIGTPVGGITDFLKDGETGVFCEVNNPESIAKQVKRLEDSKLRQTIVENAKKMVSKSYDWNLISQNMKSKVFDTLFI